LLFSINRRKSIPSYNNLIGKYAIMKANSTQFFSVMGIVNVTPDSFFDGGVHSTIDKAVDHAQMLIDQGAAILDFGGASSRPGAQIVPIDEEIARVVPVIKKIAQRSGIPISVDTTWVSVAQKALDAGATIVNDISAGRFDPGMPLFAGKMDCDIILMHSRKDPVTMQDDPFYTDVIEEVKNELCDSVKLFTDNGVRKEKISVDPGIGFAKTADHNIALLNAIDEIVNIGFPVVLGTSRKNFIGKITGRDVSDRLCGSLASIARAYQKGVRIFRVHDVKETVDFLKVFSVIESRLGVDTYSTV